MWGMHAADPGIDTYKVHHCNKWKYDGEIPVFDILVRVYKQHNSIHFNQCCKKKWVVKDTVIITHILKASYDRSYNSHGFGRYTYIPWYFGKFNTLGLLSIPINWGLICSFFRLMLKIKDKQKKVGIFPRWNNPIGYFYNSLSSTCLNKLKGGINLFPSSLQKIYFLRIDCKNLYLSLQWYEMHIILLSRRHQ